MAKFRRLIPIGNGIILVKASEMVNPHHIIELIAITNPLHPPDVIRFLMIIPTVQRIAPKLPRS